MAFRALRSLVRLIALLLATALAVAGVAVAIFSVQGDRSTLSLPRLVSSVRLDDLHASIGGFLAALEGNGSIAKVAAVAGVGAVLLGLLLLFGVLARRREPLVVIRSDRDGTIASRPRVVAQAAATLAGQSRYTLHAKAKTRARRRGTGGRLRLTIYHGQSTQQSDAIAASAARVQALTESFSLRTRSRGRVSPRRRGLS